MGVPGWSLVSSVVCGALVAGCAGAATQGTTNAAAPKPGATSSVASAAPATPAAVVPAPAPAANVDPCRVAQAVTDAAIAQAQTFAQGVMNSQISAGKYKGEMPELPIEAFETTSWLQCIKTQGGAWAIVLTGAVLTPRDQWDWKVEWLLDGDVALAHIDGSGAITFAAVETQSQGGSANGDFANRLLFPNLPNCCDWVFGGLEPLELYDFDGDGEPEVHVGASYGHEGNHERSDALLTFKNGRIESYAPAAKYNFEAMKDYTGDGIPDLRMSEELSGTEDCDTGFPGDGSGLGFIAHALPGGGFSTTDAEARAFAKERCPKRPTAINEVTDVLCARLWGGDPAKLELQVRARFSPEDCAARQAGRPQKPNARPDFELMLSAAKTDVPFTLP